MLQRMRIFEEIVVALINEGKVMKALDFALVNNVHSMKLSSFLSTVEKLKRNGYQDKALLILHRISEIKKFDEAKFKADKDYRHILVDE